MKRSIEHRAHAIQNALTVAVSLALLAGLGCKSSHVQRGDQAAEGTEHQQPAASASNEGGSGPGIDLDCVIDHIQKPTEAFHYSYNKSGTNPVEQQADITPQTIDGSFQNGGISRPVHGVRNDSSSWSGAWAGLTGIAGMSSTIALVNHSSAMVREGAAHVNGYDTLKYSIDTSRGNFAEQGLYKTTLGDGGFEKGEAWLTAEGCPVKLSLDSEMHLNNGQVDKVHYEVAMVRQ